MIVVAWRFVPAPGREAEFEAAYGPEGDWVQLFRKGEGYRGTTTARAPERGWLVLDHWDSAPARARFLEAWGEEYRALDRRCEALCSAEEEIGTFEVDRS